MLFYLNIIRKSLNSFNRVGMKYKGKVHQVSIQTLRKLCYLWQKKPTGCAVSEELINSALDNKNTTVQLCAIFSRSIRESVIARQTALTFGPPTQDFGKMKVFQRKHVSPNKAGQHKVGWMDRHLMEQ